MSRCWQLLIFLIGFSNIFAKNAIENVDINNPIIFKPNSAEDSDRFGHGLSIQKNVAVIGAPKADTHGQIFKCEFNGKTTTGDITCNKGPGIISQPNNLYHRQYIFKLIKIFFKGKFRTFIFYSFSTGLRK